MAANDDYILELLVKHGLIQPSDMEDARRAASQNGHGPVEELVRSGLVTSPIFYAPRRRKPESISSSTSRRCRRKR